MTKLLNRQNILIAILILSGIYAVYLFATGSAAEVPEFTFGEQIDSVDDTTATPISKLDVFKDPRFILLEGNLDSDSLEQIPGRATLAQDPLPPENAIAYDMQVGGKVLLLWEAPDDATVQSFTIYRSDDALDPGVAVASKRTSMQFVDMDLVDGTTYFYTIVSVTNSGEESTRVARLTAVSSDVAAPAAPTELMVADQDDGSMKLTWKLSGDEDVVEQEIYRATSRGELGERITTLEPDVAMYLDNDVDPEVVYYYSIVALDEAGNISPMTLQPSSGRINPFEPQSP